MASWATWPPVEPDPNRSGTMVQPIRGYREVVAGLGELIQKVADAGMVLVDHAIYVRLESGREVEYKSGMVFDEPTVGGYAVVVFDKWLRSNGLQRN